MKNTKSDPLAEIVDEIGDLEAEIAPYKLKAVRLEELRKYVRATYADEPFFETYEVRGARFFMMLGPRTPERIVNVSTLFKLIGPKSFLAVCKVTLKALEAACTPAVVVASIDTSDTGPRTLKVFALPVIAKAEVRSQKSGKSEA